MFVVCCMFYALLVCVCVVCVCDLLMSKWMHTPIHTHVEAAANYHVSSLIVTHLLSRDRVSHSPGSSLLWGGWSGS